MRKSCVSRYSPRVVWQQQSVVQPIWREVWMWTRGFLITSHFPLSSPTIYLPATHLSSPRWSRICRRPINFKDTKTSMLLSWQTNRPKKKLILWIVHLGSHVTLRNVCSNCDSSPKISWSLLYWRELLGIETPVLCFPGHLVYRRHPFPMWLLKRWVS